MYAVVEDGGKQYRVSEGDTVLFELKEAQPGARIEFDRVLLLSHEGDVRVGRPTVPGATVSGVVQGETRGPKLTVMRFRRRKASRTKKGHRQHYTAVRIDQVQLPSQGA